MNQKPITSYVLSWIAIALIIQTVVTYFLKIGLAADVNIPAGIIFALAFGLIAGFINYKVDQNK